MPPVFLLLLAPVFQQPGEAEMASRFGERWTPEARVFQQAGSAVVSLEVFGRVRQRTFFRGASWERRPLSQGTGVVIDPEGLLITNAHVVSPVVPGLDANSIECFVTFAQDLPGQDQGKNSARRLPGRVLNLDRDGDLALLKIEGPEPFPFIPLGRSNDLITGEKVIAIGTPYGNSHSVTSGILSGIHRDVTVNTPLGPHRFRDLIQTDAAINPGNSGGPLLNVYGELIGINTSTILAADNIGFAIPADRIREVLADRLLDVDRSPRFWAGMRVKEKEGGLEVVSLHPRGPAAQAGIHLHDRILQAGDKPVPTLADYAAELLPRESGDRIPLTARAPGGETRKLDLLLRPARDRDFFGLLGMEVKEEFLEFRRSVFRERVKVLRVAKVYPGTSAEKLGIEPGDIIVAVKVHAPEGEDPWRPVRSLAELVNVVRSPAFVLDQENLWLMREDRQYRGQLAIDDPEISPRT